MYSLTSIIHNRLAKGDSTSCHFIDFTKAFNSVDRDCLMFKLQYHGIPIQCKKAMYNNPMCTVKVNNKQSNFMVKKWYWSTPRWPIVSHPLQPHHQWSSSRTTWEKLRREKFGDEMINILLYGLFPHIPEYTETGRTEAGSACGSLPFPFNICCMFNS